MDRAELARLLGAPLAVAEPRDVIVCAEDAERFMTAFGDGVAAGGSVFLADPAWGPGEREQFAALVARRATDDDGRGWLGIPTGGSSGRLKLARHDEQTLAAAVRGFCDHFGAGRINAVGVLPLHHVSGLMAWLRCLLTGGIYLPWDGRALQAGDRPTLGEGDWYLSLVPTQLARLLADDAAVAWLRGFRAVIVGGGPVWPDLMEAAARLQLPLAFSYGMTETAAMVTALRPEEFLAGRRDCGTALPHANVAVDPDGAIRVDAESLFLGYHPERREWGLWSTEDVGRLDEDGHLHVLGRRDDVIITGGKKVDPAEVEVALRATGMFADIAVVGVPDPEWGEAVVACYPAGGEAPDLAVAAMRLEATLTPFKRPKRYLAITPWPRNAQGKVNRAEIRAAVARQKAG